MMTPVLRRRRRKTKEKKRIMVVMEGTLGAPAMTLEMLGLLVVTQLLQLQPPQLRPDGELRLARSKMIMLCGHQVDFDSSEQPTNLATLHTLTYPQHTYFRRQGPGAQPRLQQPKSGIRLAPLC